MRRLFVLITGLILYGSLYPWQFHPAGSLSSALLRVFLDWQHIDFAILKDMALNVVVYAPLGLTAYLSSASGFRWTRALWPILFGFTLSLSIETLQSYLPRTPSGLDLVCNTLGTAAGVGIAGAYESALARWFERLHRGARRPSSALMLLIVFLAHYLIPLSTDAIKLFSIYHQPALAQQWNWAEFTNTLAAWWLAGRLMEVVAGKHRWAFPAMFTGLLLAAGTRLISPNLLFTWPMLAGAAAGFIIWKMLETRGFELLYAMFALTWLVGDGLRPYQFTGHSTFDWIPFRGLLGVDWTNGVTSLLNKTWMYGAAFWTWEQAGLTRPRALAILMAVLAAIEFAQLYLPGRVSTMTDLAMGVIAAGLLWSVERKYG